MLIIDYIFGLSFVFEILVIERLFKCQVSCVNFLTVYHVAVADEFNQKVKI